MNNLSSLERYSAFTIFIMVGGIILLFVDPQYSDFPAGGKLMAFVMVIVIPVLIAKFLMDNGKSFLKWCAIGMLSGGTLSGLYALMILVKKSKKIAEEKREKERLDSMSLEEKDWDPNYELTEEEQKKYDANIKRAETRAKNWKKKVDKEKREFNTRIVNFLKEEGQKLPASDIDFRLKIKDLDRVKKVCEQMYRSGRIGRTANYRYFKN